MSEVAEKAAEAAAEVVEEAVDGVVDVVEVVRVNTAAVVVGAGLGLVVGAAAGYFIASKKLKSYYADLAQQEIAEARQFFANMNKTDEDGAVLTPMDVMDRRHPDEDLVEVASAVRRYRGNLTEDEAIAEAKDAQGGPWDEAVDERHIQKMEEEVKKKRASRETRNVFEDQGFDIEEERKHRTDDKPYILTYEEYYAADLEHEQTALTYFEGDATLVDEHDNPVREVDDVVGEENLTRFGSGSNDKNTVYVRNVRLGTDYEITRSNGYYVDEVLGLGDEPDRHPNRNTELNRRREFRRGDG